MAFHSDEIVSVSWFLGFAIPFLNRRVASGLLQFSLPPPHRHCLSGFGCLAAIKRDVSSSNFSSSNRYIFPGISSSLFALSKSLRGPVREPFRLSFFFAVASYSLVFCYALQHQINLKFHLYLLAAKSLLLRTRLVGFSRFLVPALLRNKKNDKSRKSIIIFPSRFAENRGAFF